MLLDYVRCKKIILENCSGTRVEEKALRKLLNVEDYEEYCSWINNLIKDEVIKPVLRSGPNGLMPALYKRYQVSKSKENSGYFKDEIKKLHPVFNIDGYLINHQKYSTDREIILTLDNFFRTKNYFLDEPASVNERSFQIYQKEKLIKTDSSFKSVLAYNNGLYEYLNMYQTPEPFFEHTINDELISSTIQVLIIENKDTWYTLKRIMKKNCNTLYGIQFDAIIYGEGKKITRMKDSLTDFISTYYGSEIPVCFYYFGDLDMEGIEIFESVVRVNPDLNICLFKNLYIDMINQANNLDLPMSSEHQQSSEGKLFFEYFDEEQRLEIKNLLGSGRYIPQEILTFGFFNNMIESSE